MVGLGSARRVVSLDWDWRSLRIAHAQVRGSHVRVLSLVTRQLDPGLAFGDHEGLGQFISKVLREEGISTRRAIVDVPRDQAVLNTLDLPESKDEDLAGMVHFQIVRELPFAIDEAVVDFAAEPPRGEYHQQRVLVAAVRRDVLDSYRRVFEHAGLKLERIGLRPYANLVALTHAEPEAAQGRTLFVDVGPALTEIDIVADGRLAFSRAASVNVMGHSAGSAGSEGDGSIETEGVGLESGVDPAGMGPDGAVSNILVEVTRTLEAYRATDPGGTMDRILVSGSCGVESEVAAAIGERLGKPARPYHPGEGALKPLHPSGPLTPFAAVLGLVLAQTDRTGRRFDFLHPKEPQAAQRERAKRKPMIAATIALVVMSGSVWFWKSEVQPQREYLRFLTAEVRKRKPDADAAKKFRKLVGDVVQWEKNEAIWLDEMLYVAEALPDQKEAYLTQFTGKAPGRISLKFNASGNRTPNRIADNLSAMKDQKGKPRYVARTGSTREQKDSQYPFTSQVSAELYRSVVTSKNGKKPRR